MDFRDTGGTTACRLTLGGTIAQSRWYNRLTELGDQALVVPSLDKVVLPPDNINASGKTTQTTWETESQAVPPSTPAVLPPIVTSSVEWVVQPAQFSPAKGLVGP
uniref:Uncharacterized protein n=1 Tax=Musa acuminata TaxID=4641 RepID=Q1EPC1_MUSAC|nr:hypothetical protein MA4_78I12.44 [Musa acuminata]